MLDTARLRQDMAARSMRQRDLARATDLTEGSISLILSGGRLPSLRTLKLMGDALKSDPTRWLVWVEDASAA